MEKNPQEKLGGLYAFDALLRRIFTKVVRPTERGRAWYLAAFVLVLGGFAGAYAAPEHWNRFAASVPLVPTIASSPFRLGLDLQGGSHLVYEAEMKDIPDKERTDALEGVRDVIERRVNAFGVSEPVIQTNVSGGHHRVIVELAGIKDVNDAIKEIGETPILEFKEQSTAPTRALTADEKKQMNEANAAALAKARDALKRLQAEKTLTTSTFASLAKELSEEPGAKDSGGDLGFFSRDAVVKEFADPVFDTLKVGEYTKTPVRSPFGYHLILKTGERDAEAAETDAGATGTVREASAMHILFRTKSERDFVPIEEWKGTGLTGKQLKRAQVQFDPQTYEPTVSLQFDTEGADLFSKITERNVGKPVAIFLDGAIISAPNVAQKIAGGQAVISGKFTIAEAKKLTQRLNAGALPVPITLLTQKTVGATLGDVSLGHSLFAGLIGFIAVAVFMILFYRFPGIIATAALILYTAIALAVFKLLHVTMTLAGIAGFILSIGMAVDANVLIFERVKEELRAGRPVGSALDEGFRRAWNSIRDSNASSLITCAILYWFGTSIVRGFALTLSIGILVSMFSAITITRTFLRLTLGQWASKHLWLFGVSRKPVASSQ